MNNLTPRLDRIDRNYFINGAMEYFQVAGASVGVAVPSSYDYSTVDMFELEQTGTWTSPESVRSTTKVGSNSRRSLEFTGTPGAISDEFHMRTKIESIFAHELISDKISLGLNIKSSNFTQVLIRLSFANAEDNFSSTTSVIETTINFDADSSEQNISWEDLAPPVSMANGIMIEYEFKGLTDTSATTLNVGEFILNRGDKTNGYAPAAVNQVEELSLCQRYFEKTYDTDTPVGTITGNTGGVLIESQSSALTSVRYNYNFAVNKRVLPTVEVYNPATGISGTFDRFAGGGDFPPNSYVVGVSNFSGATFSTWTGSISGHFIFDARL